MEDAQTRIDHDMEKEIKEFEESEAGVKGLVDSGIQKVPRFFYYKPKALVSPPPPPSPEGSAPLDIPVIDLSSSHPQIVEQARQAAGTWGFFQVVNHGIPLSSMEGILEATRRFHEQPSEAKRRLYSTDIKQIVRYYSNPLLRASKHADWRDTVVFDHQDGLLAPQAIPLVCRKEVCDYMEHIMTLKGKLARILSAALGLNADHLASMECLSGANLLGHYYPPCPEPDLTMGTTHHSDPFFMTLLLQDAVGGLQVLHRSNYWVDVRPILGALIVNVGDLMQLVTNDKFKSVEHRVLAGKKGPRTSVACFFYPSNANMSRPYGPIQELLNLEKKPAAAIYKEVSIVDFFAYFRSKGLDGNPALTHFHVSDE